MFIKDTEYGKAIEVEEDETLVDMEHEMFILNFVVQRMEMKLRELLGDDKYMEFSKEVALDCFKFDVESMPDGEFKTFCLENMENITT